MKVILINSSLIKKIPPKKSFQHWINAVVQAIPEKIPAFCKEIGISIVNEVTSTSLNKTYRHKSGSTNVLSFSYDPTPGILQTSLGDLVICAAIVKTEAIAQHKIEESHWAHLCIHGTLHLLGYDHAVDHDAAIMESLEIRILSNMGFDNPYGLA